MHSGGLANPLSLRLCPIRPSSQGCCCKETEYNLASEFVSVQACCHCHPSALQVDCEFTIRVVHAAAAELDLARLAGTDRKRGAAQRWALCGADGGAASWIVRCPVWSRNESCLIEVLGMTLCSKFPCRMRSCLPEGMMAHLRAVCLCLTGMCTLQQVNSSALTSPAAG